MTNPYQDIIDRLTKAEGPDHAIDMMIIDTLRDPETGNVAWNGPFPTGSLDASIALCARVLPGWDWRAADYGEDGAHATVWEHGWFDDTKVHGSAKTPPLSLLLAIFRALQAQENADG